ncbi:MAG: divalent-cation tolerance protein CutA [Pyrinomonadaceae bacterium]
MIIVFTTSPDNRSAELLARKIVNSKLAACVQVLPKMKSFYFWEGEIQAEEEHLLIVKSVASKYDALETLITENHPYDVPEIFAITAHNVSGAYHKWLTEYID